MPVQPPKTDKSAIRPDADYWGENTLRDDGSRVETTARIYERTPAQIKRDEESAAAYREHMASLEK